MTTLLRHANAEPNVTPMIDVLLVLLIFFMVMSVGVHKTMDVQLPTPCTGACDGTQPIVLEVLPKGEYVINGSSVRRDDLAREIGSIYGGRREKILYVAGGAGVTYEDVVTSMDIVKSAGVMVIGIQPRE